jgi:hypothetical protein
MAWVNTTKHTSTFSAQEKLGRAFYLLQEIADYLLQENGYKIKLQESMEWAGTSRNASTFTGITKHTSTFTPETKHTSVWTGETKH